ncbi:MalY/PatB family protein [Anaerosporobacter faecicola]|uniref:MalY/PatB family protein n=1 Tax=Anaerosporobacter faecicola TaxID=2718714 RepID=UPI00143918DE|nr:MalY/PatB family protein [Anaerosporobacter faecicola]
MGIYDFDKTIDRKNTNSLKYDFALERGKEKDVMPLWVADMDFATVPKITEAMQQRIQHGIFGYTYPKEEYQQTIIDWQKRRHNYNCRPEWLVYTPGVVFAISMAIRAVTDVGDAILVQTPVYYPFSKTIRENGRKVISNSLRYEIVDRKGVYTIDFEEFEKLIVAHSIKAFILCNPHNPVGRVWNKEELERLGAICLKHNVTIIADEIHEDFIYPTHKHIPIASLSKQIEDITITCTSPSKTFNLAGLQLSNIIISNKSIRSAFRQEIDKTGYDEPNILGVVACQAAYTFGEEWLEELKQYLLENIRFVQNFIETQLPKVVMTIPEGTYLVWLDFNGYGISAEELEERIQKKGKLWLDEGIIFGDEGKGFERINIAAPKKTIEEAMNRIYDAFKDLEL